MSYKRKTHDEWQIWALIPDYSNKGSTWEELSAYDNRLEARADLKSYKENDRSFIDIKIKKTRVKNES